MTVMDRVQVQEYKGEKNLTGLCPDVENSRSTINIFCKSLFVVVLGLPALCLAATASDELSESARPAISVDEIAMELSNPVTALRSLAVDIEGTSFQGNLPDADGRAAMKTVLTPSWPFKLKNGNNILIRATIPINSDQPLWELSEYDHSAEWRLRQREDIRLEQGHLTRGTTTWMTSVLILLTVALATTALSVCWDCPLFSQ